MKKIGLGMKISLGFGVLIVMSILLGGKAVWDMSRERVQITILADEHIPEVDVATELRGAVNRLMYEMRGYGFTEEQGFYDAALKELALVEVSLEKARSLAAEATDLTKLKDRLEQVASALDAYEELSRQTFDITAKLNANRRVLETSSEEYMANAAAFLSGQNEKLKRVLNERQEKIKIVTQFVENGSVARVFNYKFRALGHEALMQNAISTIDSIAGLLPYLRSITRDKANLKHIDGTETAAQNYKNAMDTFLVERRKGRMADDRLLETLQIQMDEAAAIYVENCDAFLASQQNNLSVDVLNNQLKVTMVNEIIELGHEIRVGVYKSQTLRDPQILRNALHDFSSIETSFESLKSITYDSDDFEKITTVQSVSEVYRDTMTQCLENWLLLQELGDKRSEAGKTLINACKITADEGMKATQQIAGDAVKTISHMSRLMVIGLTGALLLGIVAAFFIIRSITAPVKHIVGGLSDGASQVASASIQVSSVSQSMAEGSSEQAATIEETASSMEEMASMTKNNAQNADQADRLMKDVNQVVNDATGSMERLSHSMDGIYRASEETSRIIKSIDEIAFQTNLLALNAAVEAARAGEAGAGFAVVADEVRNLAVRAAEAAKNTATLIQGTAEQINEGAQQVVAANNAFGKVSESTAKVGALVSEISHASKEQFNGIEQVNKAIAEMDRVVQQNAANAEESASTAEEMSAQAQQLREHVEKLVMLITGRKKDRFLGADENEKRIDKMMSSAQSIALADTGPHDEKKTVHQHNEIRPDQVIPFDDDFEAI